MIHIGPMADAARLTAQQERDLVRATEAGDLAACRRLVEAFLPAIAAQARRLPVGLGVQRQELIQEGVAGLPRDDHLQRHRTEPATDDLVAATGLTREQIDTLRAARRTPRSLEEQQINSAGGMRTVGDDLPDSSAEVAYDLVLDEIEIRHVRNLADQLGERERAVILAHYGLGQPAQTLKQIGGTLGLTARAGPADRGRRARDLAPSARATGAMTPRGGHQRGHRRGPVGRPPADLERRVLPRTGRLHHPRRALVVLKKLGRRPIGHVGWQ
jgi:RNA polymerase sigma factor (sigma-70 family)